jgi:hypothetical protein
MGQKAAGAQRKAAEYQRQQGDLQAARQKRDAIRQARIAMATAQQGAQNQGAAGSSAALGGVGSIQSQMGATLSFLDQFNFLSDQASIQLGKANQFAANADTAAGIGKIASSIFGQFGGGGSNSGPQASQQVASQGASNIITGGG